MGGQENRWRFTSPRGTFENTAVHGQRTPNRAGHEHLRKTRNGRLLAAFLRECHEKDGC